MSETDKKKFKEFYSLKHKAPHLIKKSIYSLPELTGDKIKKFQQDEEGHKQTAINRGSKEVFAYKALRHVLRKTTQAAVYFAERI
mgnify:CR=1 FL=1